MAGSEEGGSVGGIFTASFLFIALCTDVQPVNLRFSLHDLRVVKEFFGFFFGVEGILHAMI